MTPNQSLCACQSVLTKLNAAIDMATAEVTHAKAAERRVAELLARVADASDHSYEDHGHTPAPSSHSG
jgi:hypothetical protein